MNYQVDYGQGFETVLPDGYGMHSNHEIHGRYVIGYSSPSTNPYFAVSHSDLQEIEKQLDKTEPDASWTEWGRSALVTDQKAIVEALKAKESGKVVLHSTDEDGDYFIVLDAKGPLGIRKDHEEYIIEHDEDCESCWSPESGDSAVWFDAIFENGAERARCGNEEYTATEWAARKVA